MKKFGLFRVNYKFSHKVQPPPPVLVLLVMVIFFVPTIVIAQSSAQRDPEALTILAQTISAGGGHQLLASVQDMTGNGQIIYGISPNEIQGNVTVKTRGLHQLKIDADLATGKRTIVVNDSGGVLIEENGKSHPLHRQSALNLGSITLPYLPLIAALQDLSFSILNEGLVAHDSVSVYDIRFQKIYTKAQDPRGVLAPQSIRDIYIDPKTYLITAISDHLYFGGANSHGMAHEDLYSAYQSSNGVMMPLTIVQTVNGMIGFTLNLRQTMINTNLTDADFIW